MEMIIAAIYALVVAVSYKKTGLLAALFWPITMIFVGIMVYINVVFAPEKEQ